MRGKEKSESGKARLRAKTSAESEDEEIRRGDKRKQKVRKRAKKEESVQKQGKEPPPRRILALPTPNHTARNPPP